MNKLTTINAKELKMEEKIQRINFEIPEGAKREIMMQAAIKNVTIKQIGIKLFSRWVRKNKNSKNLTWLK